MTLPLLFSNAVKKNLNSKLYASFSGKSINYISTAEFYEKVKYLTLGLHSIGFKKGEKVALASATNPAVIMADLAISIAGGIPVTIEPNFSLNALNNLFEHLPLRYLFCGYCNKIDLIRSCKSQLRKIIPIDADIEGKDIMTLGSISAWGREIDRTDPGLFIELIKKAEKSQTATIHYILSETEAPKEKLLKHSELYRLVEHCKEKMNFVDGADSVLSIATPYQSCDRILYFTMLDAGASSYFVYTAGDVEYASSIFKPSYLSLNKISCVKLHDILVKKYSNAFSPLHAFDMAAAQWAENTIPGRGGMVKIIVNLLFLRSFKNRLGGKVKAIINRSDEPDKKALRFFKNMNIPVKQVTCKSLINSALIVKSLK